MAYDNTNSGALFRNEKRESERSPEYKGTINIEGVEYWLSSWIKESKGGKKYMSLSAKPKEEKRETVQNNPPLEDFDDVLPF